MIKSPAGCFWLLVLLLCTGCAGSPQVSHDSAGPGSPRGIDADVRRVMEREHVNGLALAVIEDGRVARVEAYGRRNVERDLPLQADTVMYGASLTKTAFAYLVLQLVDEKRVTLDTPLATLLTKPLPEYREFADLAGDERWRMLTPRIVLTHTTGFANFRWIEDDKKLRFHSQPGSRYGYSGEGFYILQLAIEEGLHLDVGKEMQTRLFDRFGMTRTGMTWRPAFADNLADGYTLEGALQPHDERGRASAAGSMDTTIADQAKMWAAIVRGDDLSAAARAEMVRPQVPITSAHQFPTLRDWTDKRNAKVHLSAGLGLVTFQDTAGPAFFKGGHDDGTGNMVVCLETPRRCVVLLSNDVRAERIYPEVVKLLLGDTRMPWYWEYGWLEGKR
jgi:CubicO group peptidase (beta-lactamase class C family)